MANLDGASGPKQTEAATLERTISSHVAACGFEDLPPAAVEAAKYSILDTIGVMLAATTNCEDCTRIVSTCRTFGGTPQSSVIGYGDRLPAPMAALANGALCHPLDFDDTHEGSKCHSSASTLPAALALAQALGNVGGREFVTAIAVASDVVCRIAEAVELGPTEHGWLGTAIYGHFGGAAAAARILGLDAEQTAHALGIVLCQTAGSREMAVDSSYRGIRDGFPQKAAVMAALLAKEGMTGPSRFLTGKYGLYNLYFKGRFSPEVLLDGLGREFEGANVSFKLWPACKLTHNYIDALFGILDENGLADGDVAEVSLRVSTWGRTLSEPIAERRRPRSEITARDSIPFTLGVALARRGVRIEDFQLASLSDATVCAAADRITYVFDPDLDPAEMSPGDVTVRTTDGRTFQKTVRHVYGSPQNPISREDLVQKFRDCAAHSCTPIAPDRIERAIETILDLENRGSIEDLAI